MVIRTGFKFFCVCMLMTSGLSEFSHADTQAVTRAADDRLLIGYWHNFDNGSGFLKLRDVSPAYDVIHVAFAEPVDTSQTMTFTPFQSTADEFKADITTLQKRGRKVLISIGGANAHVRLDNEEKKKNFIESMHGIIRTYGFDGIDIDQE